MTILTHLWRAYRPVYLWFWGVMAVLLAGIVVISEVFGRNTVEDKQPSVWLDLAQQAPSWFLFVMGLLFVTVNLPVIVAAGFTRRAHFRAAMAFIAVSSAGFTALILLGFAVERAIYAANGMMARLKNPYPIDSWVQAGSFAVESFLKLLAFALFGWICGLLFYRMRVWLAVALTPLAALSIAGVVAPLSDNRWVEIVVALTTVAVSGAIGYLLVRTVPIRAKKA